jgi:hypothetical protein
MAKIVEAIRPTAAHRIAHERQAISDCEREIADLQKARDEQLLADDPGIALATSDKLAAAERRLAVHEKRLKAFEGQGRREATDRRQQQKTEALAAFEKQFAGRGAAAARVGAAVKELSESLKEYRAACRLPFASWPHDLFPSIKTFEGSSYSYAESKIGGALRMQSASPALFDALGARLGDLAERDIALGASIFEDIRNSPLPKQPEIDEAA